MVPGPHRRRAGGGEPVVVHYNNDHRMVAGAPALGVQGVSGSDRSAIHGPEVLGDDAILAFHLGDYHAHRGVMETRVGQAYRGWMEVGPGAILGVVPVHNGDVGAGEEEGKEDTTQEARVEGKG